MGCIACLRSTACQYCCAIFSFIAALVLAAFGMLCAFQWEYVELIDNETQAQSGMMNSFISAAAYLVLCIACTSSIVFKEMKKSKTAYEGKESVQGLELNEVGNAGKNGILAILPDDAHSTQSTQSIPGSNESD